MSTTTIRIPSDLKARIAAEAKQSGKTVHSYMLEALAEKIQLAAVRSEFSDEADARFEKIAAGGHTVSWAVARKRLEGRLNNGLKKAAKGTANARRTLQRVSR